MAERYLIVDDATGRFKRGAAYNDTDTYILEDFDVSGGPEDTFVLANLFSINQLMDVFLNGQLLREGASFDFERDVGTHTVILNAPVSGVAWIRVKLLNPTAIVTPSVEDFDVSSGGLDEFDSTNIFAINSTIEVYVNGQLKREGDGFDYERNISLQKIVFSTTVPENAWVRIRIY